MCSVVGFVYAREVGNLKTDGKMQNHLYLKCTAMNAGWSILHFTKKAKIVAYYYSCNLHETVEDS